MKLYISAIILSLVSQFSMNSYAEPATIFRGDNTCGGFVPNGDSDTGLPSEVYWDGDVHIVARDAGVETFPGSGKLTCKGHHYEILGNAHIGKGFVCFIHTEDKQYITTDSITVASPSGEIITSCQFKKGSTIVIDL
jgi:hypothetical protein